MKQAILLYLCITISLSLVSFATDNPPFLQKPIENDGAIFLIRRKEIGFNKIWKLPIYWYEFVFRSANAQEHLLGTMQGFNEQIPIGAEVGPVDISAVVSRADGTTGVLLNGMNSFDYHLLFNQNALEAPAAISFICHGQWEELRPRFKMTEPNRIVITMNGKIPHTPETHVLVLRDDHIWTLDGTKYELADCFYYQGVAGAQPPDARSSVEPTKPAVSALQTERGIKKHEPDTVVPLKHTPSGSIWPTILYGASAIAFIGFLLVYFLLRK